jgi:hypothetical protein
MMDRELVQARDRSHPCVHYSVEILPLEQAGSVLARASNSIRHDKASRIKIALRQDAIYHSEIITALENRFKLWLLFRGSLEGDLDGQLHLRKRGAASAGPGTIGRGMEVTASMKTALSDYLRFWEFVPRASKLYRIPSPSFLHFSLAEFTR